LTGNTTARAGGECNAPWAVVSIPGSAAVDRRRRAAARVHTKPNAKYAVARAVLNAVSAVSPKMGPPVPAVGRAEAHSKWFDDK